MPRDRERYNKRMRAYQKKRRDKQRTGLLLPPTPSAKGTSVSVTPVLPVNARPTTKARREPGHKGPQKQRRTDFPPQYCPTTLSDWKREIRLLHESNVEHGLRGHWPYLRWPAEPPQKRPGRPQSTGLKPAGVRE